MVLDQAILKDLGRRYEELDAKGSLLSNAQLASSYAAFRQRFSPEVLRDLDGQALLQKIHGRETQDSLMYWLEFKSDEEFLTRSWGASLVIDPELQGTTTSDAPQPPRREFFVVLELKPVHEAIVRLASVNLLKERRAV